MQERLERRGFEALAVREEDFELMVQMAAEAEIPAEPDRSPQRSAMNHARFEVSLMDGWTRP